MVKRKIVAQTQNDDWTPKKVRKKRKPMTPEQRLAAAERLEKARAAKAPAKKQSIHQNVISLPDDHPLSAQKVKNWIKSNKEMSSLGKISPLYNDYKTNYAIFSEIMVF